jgi:thiol-disulfide isomerase/thioredoxin
MHLSSLILAALGAVLPQDNPETAPTGDAEIWRLELGSVEAPLPFFLRLEREPTARAWIQNGEEEIPVAGVTLGAAGWLLEFPHYDSRLSLTLTAPDRAQGHWEKRRSAEQTARLEVRAERGVRPRFAPLPNPPPTASPAPAAIAGDWQLTFDSSAQPAIGRFEVNDAGLATGTVLTVTGDHRFLAGSVESGRLRLSCFDGAHAFLYDLLLTPEGTLQGTFRSGDWHSEAVRGERQPAARLADAYSLLSAQDAWPLAMIELENAAGEPLWLGSRAFAGQPLLVQVFGSWCPNCHDEAALLRTLAERYEPRGLRILGLAAEFGGELERDWRQIQRYGERHRLNYPLLRLCDASKGQAGQSLGLSQPLVAFPTTLFIGADGSYRWLHSGFSGPAAPAEHAQLVAEFEAHIESLLSGETAAGLPLGQAEWIAWGHSGAPYRFVAGAPGEAHTILRLDPEGRKPAVPAEGWLRGASLELEGQRYVLVPSLGVFVNTARPDWRLVPKGATLTPSVWRWGDTREQLLQLAQQGNPQEQSEALLALAYVERSKADAQFDTLLTAALQSAHPAHRAVAYSAAALAERPSALPNIERALTAPYSFESNAAEQAIADLQRLQRPTPEQPAPGK